MLEALLQRSTARIHLLGHSYGCKVVMTALCAPATLPRPVESVLLLQPAISQYAFAERVPDRDQPGGFRRALDRVRLPVAVTYSAEDVALHDMFHLSVRRKEDLGELQFAGEGSTPSRFAAMGGYGPQESGARWIGIQPPGTAYLFDGSSRVLAINGTRHISGHGEISNPATWWLSTELVGAHARGG
jgi:pimeloyl-ACP methyl ester carboxylesterase